MPGSRISPEELALFNSQLAAIARSEVPALPGLRALSRDIRGGRLRRVLDRLTSEIESGKPLPDALSAVSENLPPTYTAMVQAGIESRNLPAVLESMTRHYQATEELKDKVHSALIYPAIVYVLCVVLLVALSFIITPLMIEMVEPFKEFNIAGLPSAYAAVPVILWAEVGLAILILLAVLGLKIASLGQAGARFGERVRNSIPIYGPVGANGSLSRFCSTLALLLEAEVPLARALELARLATGSPMISAALAQVSERTSQGTGLSESLQATRTFPHTLVWMVSQGEQTNSLGETFNDLADFYTHETNRRATFASNATTPLAVIVLLISAAPTVFAFFWMIMTLVNLMNSLGG